MNLANKLRPSIFLNAAILLHDYSLNGRDGMGGSPYCCDCIEEAISEADKDGDELEFFEDMFKPESPKNGLFGWWEVGRVFCGYEGPDYESRLLALLLCVEMIRDKH